MYKRQLEKSIVDGVNVDCRVYRIKTQVTETGGAILEGEKFKEETRSVSYTHLFPILVYSFRMPLAISGFL